MFASFFITKRLFLKKCPSKVKQLIIWTLLFIVYLLHSSLFWNHFRWRSGRLEKWTLRITFGSRYTKTVPCSCGTPRSSLSQCLVGRTLSPFPSTSSRSVQMSLETLKSLLQTSGKVGLHLHPVRVYTLIPELLTLCFVTVAGQVLSMSKNVNVASITSPALSVLSRKLCVSVVYFTNQSTTPTVLTISSSQQTVHLGELDNNQVSRELALMCPHHFIRTLVFLLTLPIMK